MYLIAAKDTFLLLLLHVCSPSAGIAQLVEYPTEKPGAILTRVQVPGTARDFSQSQSTFSADSVQPPVAIACINICAHVKHPEHWQPKIVMSVFGLTHKNTAHTDRNE